MKKTASAAKKKMATTAQAKNRTAGAPRLSSSAAPLRGNPLFAPGSEVEVRSRFTQPAIVFSGAGAEREVVIYARATVVSASPGTASYLVRYPAAAGTLPSRVARVPASYVREPRRRRPTTAVDAAPARPKRKPTGRGIPMDALLRFFEEHEREEEEAAKKKRKVPEQDDEAELARKPLQMKQDAPVFFRSLFS